MDLNTTILMQLVCASDKDADLDATPTSELDLQFTDTLTDGTGLDQADMLWFDDASMIADATDTLDLNATLTDIYGDSVDMVRVKCIFFKNTSTTASELQVGPHAAANPFQMGLTSVGGATGNEAIIVPKGGAFCIFTPDATAYAVGAGATDDLEVFEASSLAALYEIAIVGASA